MQDSQDLVNHFQFSSSIGTFALTWGSRGLTCIDWYKNVRTRSLSPLASQSADLDQTDFSEMPADLGRLIRSFRDYLENGVPIQQVPWHLIDASGWTLFQRQVYQVISEIPHGETRTYAWVARRMGRGTAARAVGQALKNNPLPLLIPCHRVVAANALGGFMGSEDPTDLEISLKKCLIDLESRYLNPMFSFIEPIGSDFWSAAS